MDAAIEIGFIGPNVDTLVALTNQALEIMHRNPDLINVRNSWGNKVPVWKPVYSPERYLNKTISTRDLVRRLIFQIGIHSSNIVRDEDTVRITISWWISPNHLARRHCSVWQ